MMRKFAWLGVAFIVFALLFVLAPATSATPEIGEDYWSDTFTDNTGISSSTNVTVSDGDVELGSTDNITVVDEGFEDTFYDNNWTRDSDYWDQSGSQVHAGSYSAHVDSVANMTLYLKLNDGLADLSGAVHAYISFWYCTDESYEDDDYFDMDIYYSGTWHDEYMHINEGPWADKEWIHYESELPAEALQSDFTIRFSDGSDGKWEDLYIDEFKITYTEYKTSGNLTSTAITPQNLTSWGTFIASHNLPTNTHITYRILNASDDSTLCTITAAQAAAGYNISSCAGTTGSIKLYANLTTTNASVTPTLYDWKVTWTSEVAPTVGVPVVTASMTPQSQAWVNVTITDNNKLSDLSTVETVLFYDSDGSYTDPGASPTPNTQTLAIMTWYAENDTFAIQSGSPTSWSIDNSTSTHDALTGTTGEWKFSFKPGKVATEATGKWFARVNATDSASLVGSNHTTSGSTMQWYGEITVETSTVSWGTVTPGCTDVAQVTPSTVNITYICNGDYNEQVKTSQNWTSASGNVTLNTTGSPGAGEFSMKADDDATVEDAVQVLSASYTTFDTGTQTTEAGNVENNNHLWLSLGSGIPVDTYSGTLYFCIAP